MEENFRKAVYHDNQRMIELHNEKYNLGLYSYKIKMNQFGDMVRKKNSSYVTNIYIVTWKKKLVAL